MTPHTTPRALRHTALLIHLTASGGVVALLTLIWALTTRSYFWPFWPALPLAMALAIHWLVTALLDRPELWRRRGMTFALAIHVGVSLVIELALIASWLATGAGYFWPAWPFLGLAIAVGVHWAVVIAARIEHLETARTTTVALQDDELRRIERDLHDGAQARLVALGISLGLAEQKFDTDPAAARALVTEARSGVGEALREMRDLVRGIRPPVLADRGLEAAIAALADRSPIPVDVVANVRTRPADPVETAAYFVVAEALTNAAKHAGASRIDVRIDRVASMLVVQVIDDGCGGADPTGAGLLGLRRRIESLDGTFAVTSPRGGPTI
ncbi:MAG TPA: histidine kinase, partial [Acidimicrobiales bacterium]